MSKAIPNWIPGLFALLSLVGVLDAGYLTVEHFRGQTPACNLLHGCEIVTTSTYSEVAGVPVARFGVFFYLVILGLSVYYFDKRNRETLTLLSRLTPLGLAAAVYFTSIQAFVLQAWCQWCIGSAITSTLLFLLGWYYLLRYRPEPKQAYGGSDHD